MKLALSLTFFCIALFFMEHAKAQNTKSEKVEYTYIQSPIKPLPKTVKNYQASIYAKYEEDNQKKIREYEADVAAAEADFRREQAEYPSKLKAAEDKYAAEMAEWNKKSMTEKVVEKQLLNENNKPTKQLPREPYKRSVSQPKLKTSYDYPVLAASNIKLDGYNNAPEGAVKIEVTLYGFEYTPPRQMTEQKSMVSTANGTTTTSMVNYYHVEFTYRHTMSVRVVSPEGVELFMLSPSELNNYQTYKSAASKTAVSYNEEQLVKTHEEKILQENLRFINELVNDLIGFRKVSRTTELNYVKAKGETYSDLMNAFNEASTGLKLLLDDPTAAASKLEKSIQQWETALKESNVADKKARIDKDVTIIICFNLLEVYFATANIEQGEKIIQMMNSISMSARERSSKEAYELAFTDLKKRISANQ